MKFYTCCGYAFIKSKPRPIGRTCGITNHDTRLFTVLRRSIMRIKLIVLFIGIAMLKVTASSVNAQTISVSMENAPLEKVFSEIEKQSGYVFWYDKALLKTAKKVSIKVRSAKLTDVLDQCFQEQPLFYKIVENTIVVQEKEKPVQKTVRDNQKAITISGKVTDRQNRPLTGVSVKIKSSSTIAVTDNEGKFSIAVPDRSAILIFSYVGYKILEHPVSEENNLNIRLEETSEDLGSVNVVNTGYQSLPKERAVGSFQVIDNTLLNRSVSTNFLDRLKGVTTGLQFSNDATVRRIQTNPNFRNTGVTIRGVSTFLSSTDPLIVVDNFPFEGELSSLNPNDIESVTILKDASAASIWGARSGNGVIVITTKRGKKNEKMKFDFNTNLTVAAKPDLFYSPRFVTSKDFIDVEQYLFDKGYFNSDLTNTSNRPVVSPSVEIMAQVRANTISAAEGQARLAALAQNDVRKDLTNYVYQNAINQQYSLALSGGAENLSYRLSVGLDQNRDALIRNGFNRMVVNSLNTYNPLKNLELTIGLNYTKSKTLINNDISSYTVNSSKYLGNIFPYSQFVDDQGDHLSVINRLRESYLQESAQKGYLDWHYRPLDELELADNSTDINSMLSKISASYKIIPSLTVEVNYQNELQRIIGRKYQSQDTYFIRDLINKFSVYNTQTNTLSYNYPFGGQLDKSNYEWSSNILRGQLNYNYSRGKHAIYAIAGAEVRQLKTDGSTLSLVGYDDQFGTSVSNLNYQASYPTSPSGSALLPNNTSNITGILNRYTSYYGNASYSFDNKYLLSGSVRRDGANLFGAKTNNKFTPLWSVGGGWKISKESFYHFDAIPYLQLRATYGFNGNTYSKGTALLTARYSSSSITGAQTLVNVTAPNSELRWEKVKNINLGLDFESKGRIVSGSVEYYFKNGIDLIQPTALAPQTGFITYTANTAKTQTRGIDVTLNVGIINKEIKWNMVYLFSKINDKVVSYDAPYTTLRDRGGVIGEPLNALFSYKWEGLNPQTGAPIGLLNGNKSENYGQLVNNLTKDALVYSGSAIPTIFGNWRNDFAYKDFSLSVNISYSLNYFFRRASISTNYTGILTSEKHSDYSLRWQKPGDELITNVPSLVYPDNGNRSLFYAFSETHITPGDHIRLQDVRLSYDFSNLLQKTKTFKHLQAFLYAKNLGIIWRKNKFGLDPNANSAYPDPFTVSAGINANF